MGNKKDLRYDKEVHAELSTRNQKPVSSDEAQNLALKIKAFAYLECSAKTREGVVEIFENAARASMSSRKKVHQRKCRLL